jgi:hypothetical protein
MPYFYASGDEIRQGDRITLHGEPGEIEFVADAATDPSDYFVREYGGGVMVTAFGAVFLSDPADKEDLILVARSSDGK